MKRLSPKDIAHLIERLERTGEMCEDQARRLADIAKRMFGSAHYDALQTMATAFREEAAAIKNHMRMLRGDYGEYQVRQQSKRSATR